ncbi:hypothetical protein EVAR_52611_1 [Eumeta japonica]|uniref:Uncharacterized protein n=1 Tax=Eumeta variegata TaxID=151549 RepID=A0A4C1YPU8_EUMVA|nr:hypothetical protein EVAR_52611_1 [Eumeta japonica]
MDELSVKCLLNADDQVILKINESVKKRGMKDVHPNIHDRLRKAQQRVSQGNGIKFIKDHCGRSIRALLRYMRAWEPLESRRSPLAMSTRNPERIISACILELIRISIDGGKAGEEMREASARGGGRRASDRLAFALPASRDRG